MAVSNLRAPTASAIGEVIRLGAIVEVAARIAVLIAIVTFVVFLRALHAPKTSKLGEEPHPRRSQQPVGIQKKKGNRAKKGKKPRGTASTKIAPEPDVISEEELEVGRVQSSSDVEAPSMRDYLKQESHSEVGVDQDKSESESESGDIEIEILTDEASLGCGHVCLEAVPLDDPSEEELEVGRVQSSSDVEAHAKRDSLKQESHSEVGADEDKSESESESDDIEMEMHTDEASSGCGHVCLQTVLPDDPVDELPPISDLLDPELIVPSDTSIIAFNDFDWEEVHEPSQSKPADDADVPCKECSLPDMHLWGCAAHRTYTSALLLMHREMQVVVARGPPGLERPAAPATASRASLCSMRVD